MNVSLIFFCSTTSDYTLKAVPPISEEYSAIASKITAAFLGDPSFFAYNGEDPEAEPEDPEAKPVERFREVHRLTYTIQVCFCFYFCCFSFDSFFLQKIDHDCFLVPRGALSVDTGKRVLVNSNYQGLSYQTSSELRAYLHLRRPENPQGIALMKRPGIVKTDDFLDCIDKDLPKGIDSLLYLTKLFIPILSQKCGPFHMITHVPRLSFEIFTGKGTDSMRC